MANGAGNDLMPCRSGIAMSARCRRCSGRNNHWCTLNEPMVYALWGYIEGIFPPLERRAAPVDVAPVVAQLLEPMRPPTRISASRCGSARQSFPWD
ncbi:MAG: hypothetical protein CM15mP74_35620 [Halieaceae bacterium]|nr:MAG: hypothetical protein CM15mP74_35620 [Halieaceae bacterium]